MRSDNNDKTTNIIRGKLGEGPGCGSAQRGRSWRGENLYKKGPFAAVPIVICEAATGAGEVGAIEGMEAERLKGPRPRPARPLRPAERPQVGAQEEPAWQEAG